MVMNPSDNVPSGKLPAPSPATSSENVTSIRAKKSTWDFETAGYGRDRFYTRSKESDGHYDWLKCRVPTHLYDQARYYASKESPFPFRSINDVVRDALVHEFAYLSEVDPREEQRNAWQIRMTDENLVQRMMEDEAARKFVDAMIEQVDSLVETYLRRHQLDIAMERLQYWLDEIPDLELAHHDYVKNHIKEKMGHVRDLLLKQRKEQRDKKRGDEGNIGKASSA